MIVYPNSGLGSEVSAVGTSVGGAIASAGGVVSGTIIGLPAGAVLAAVGGLVALGSQIAGALHVGEGCGPTCIQATQVVNQVEPVLRDNLHSYQSGQMDRATAVENFSRLWGVVQQSCGAIPGAAGQNCIGDRQQGACKWKDNGKCWNWFVGYRDPLDIPVNTTNSGAVVGQGINLESLTSSPLVLGVGIIALGFMLSRS